MPIIKPKEIEIYYEIYGKGLPIVLISGFSGNHTNWRENIAQLSQDYQVIVFDNRGVGQSSCPNYPYTVEMMADDVIDLCQALHLPPAVFIGCSMGGVIAQTLAYRYPQHTRAAVLTNSMRKISSPFGLFATAALDLMQANCPLPALVHTFLSWCHSESFLQQPGKIDELTSFALNDLYPMSIEGYGNQLAALLQFDTRQWIHKITCPTLFIYSDQDLIVPVSESTAMIKSIVGAKSYCFKDNAHLSNLELPEAFNNVVLKFTKELK